MQPIRSSYILIDSVEDKIVVLFITGVIPIVSQILSECGQHLREIGPRGRRKLYEDCTNILHQYKNDLVLNCIAIREHLIKESIDKVLPELRNFVEEIVEHHDISQPLDVIVELNDYKAKYIYDSIHAILQKDYNIDPKLKRADRVRKWKKRLGLVEVVGRGELGRQRKKRKYKLKGFEEKWYKLYLKLGSLNIKRKYI